MNANRCVNLGIACLALFVVLASFYMENVLGMKACTLCLIQRAIFGLIFLLSFIAFFHHRQLITQKFYAGSNLLLGLLGLVVAARQVLLQQQPMSVAHHCLPRFSYMVENMPANKALELFKGNTSCSDFVWTYQGLSLAAWATVAFSIIVLFMLAQALSLRCAGGACKNKSN